MSRSVRPWTLWQNGAVPTPAKAHELQHYRIFQENSRQVNTARLRSSSSIHQSRPQECLPRNTKLSGKRPLKGQTMAYEMRSNPGNRLGRYADKIEVVREQRELPPTGFKHEGNRRAQGRKGSDGARALSPTCPLASASQPISRLTPFLRISVANSGPNLFHQNRTVS